MIVAALDPGGTIGFALVDHSTGHIETRTYTDPVLAFRAALHADVVVIEDFIGSGPRDANAVLTLKQAGGFELCARLLGVPVALQVPQHRRAFLPEASKHHATTVHETDALAHALAFIHRRKDQLDHGTRQDAVGDNRPEARRSPEAGGEA